MCGDARDARGPVRARVYYALSRLLRPFALHYAPFSRTVKGEGAKQTGRGVAEGEGAKRTTTADGRPAVNTPHNSPGPAPHSPSPNGYGPAHHPLPLAHRTDPDPRTVAPGEKGSLNTWIL